MSATRASVTDTNGITHAVIVRLTTVRSRAASLLGGVCGTAIGQRTVVDTLPTGPLRIVWVINVQPPRARGTLGGRIGKRGQTRTRHLTSVGTLATGKHAVVRGTSAISKGKRTRVQARSFAPRSVIVRVPEINATGSRGRHGGRGGELAEAHSRRLTSVCLLAACELSLVIGTIAFVIERQRELVGAASVGPGFFIFRVPEISLKVRGGGGTRGRRGELGETVACDYI